MKIGINALFLQTPATGSGQYLKHLLGELAEIDQHNEYVLLGAKPVAHSVVQKDCGQIPFAYNVSSVPAFARRNDNIEKLVWEQFTGPAAARKAGVDLFH